MSSRNPEVSRWNELLGPFWTTRAVQEYLQITGTVGKLRQEQLEFLGIRTKDGIFVFPEFQFVQDQQTGRWSPVRGLQDVLKQFKEVVAGDGSDWTLASWLNVQRKDLEGRSVVDYLKQGGDISIAVTLAREAASRWSH